MRIGIDVDNVISNFDDALLEEFLKHDKTLRNNGIVNKKAKFVTNGMFDWSKEEVDSFYTNNIERIAKNLKVKDGVREYIDKLKQDGHRIYIITGRENGEYTDAYSMTKDWLDKNLIRYDKLILTDAYEKEEKAVICRENNIDVMVDDSVGICKHCIKNNIKTFLMDTPYNRFADLPRVNNFKDFYNEVCKMNN